MKRMKIALVAMFAIFMGTTFTSCLDSDDSPNSYMEIVTIDDYTIEFTKKVKSDAGYTLEIQNPTSMQLTDKSYPRRALIGWQEIEGADYTPGQSNYNAYFSGYYIIYSIGNTTMFDVTSVTPINRIEANATGIGVSGNYLNLIFNITYDDNTDPEDDFELYFKEVKNGMLYCKLVHTEAVETSKAKTGSHSMSFPLPSKGQLQSYSQFADLEFTGDDKKTIKLVVTADGPNDTEIESVQFTATLN